MNLSLSSSSAAPEMTAKRTDYPADSDHAVQVFLVDSFSAMYLTVAEARAFGERLLAAAAFLVLYVVLAETRGAFVTWDGLAPIPTGGVQ